MMTFQMKSPSVGNVLQNKEYSKADEVWTRVTEIMDGGVLAMVDSKQAEARDFLKELEGRLEEIITSFNNEMKQEGITIPESAATFPGGVLNNELQRVIPAINMINDKELKFRLTTFIDDYRRILTQNRDVEKAQVLAELEEHFKEGACAFVNLNVETDEMINSMAVVEKEAKKMIRLRDEVLEEIQILKGEKETAIGLVPTLPETVKPWADALSAVAEIMNKPHVKSALGPDDLQALQFNLDVIKQEASKGSPERRKSTTQRRISISKSRRLSDISDKISPTTSDLGSIDKDTERSKRRLRRAIQSKGQNKPRPFPRHKL